MKVSIITVTYNCADTLEDAIKSVLSQDYQDVEYIVVDGNSTDGTIDVINRYKDRISVAISEPDEGIYDAMNKGVRLATGDIVGFLNSDDFYASEHIISTVVETFQKQPDLDGVHGNLYYVDAKNVQKIVRYWKTCDYVEGAFFRGWHPAHPTLYLKRELYQRYGGFRTELTLSADFELMLRLFERKYIHTRHLDLVMVIMRLGGATSRNMNAIFKGVIQCRKAFLMNGFKYPLYYPFSRLIPKLIQYFRKK